MERPKSLSGNANGAHLRHQRPDRKRDVENLITELQDSPNPENTGAIGLNHIAHYDDDFLDALAELVAGNRARGRTSRVRALEAVRAELVAGAARDAAPDGGWTAAPASSRAGPWST